MKKILLVSAGTIALVALLIWAYMASSQSLPGEAKLQEGREHRPEGTKLTYNFNPPTSGDHYATWIKKGVYDLPRPDGNLVHSQEHGYIIFWYDCSVQVQSWLDQYSPLYPVLAQDVPAMAPVEGSGSATLTELPESFKSADCEQLKSQLQQVYNDYGPHKLIVMPRLGMSSRVVLTAWGKMQSLNSADKAAIKSFIDAYRDRGPEATNEP